MIDNPYNPNTAAPVADIHVGEYVVGFGEPVSVVSDTPTLVLTLNVLAGTGYDQYFFLSPVTQPRAPCRSG